MENLIFIYFTGYQKAREAVAEYSSNEFVKVDPKVGWTRAYIECRKQIGQHVSRANLNPWLIPWDFLSRV